MHTCGIHSFQNKSGTIIFLSTSEHLSKPKVPKVEVLFFCHAKLHLHSIVRPELCQGAKTAHLPLRKVKNILTYLRCVCGSSEKLRTERFEIQV